MPMCDQHKDLIALTEKNDKRVNEKLDKIDIALRGEPDGTTIGVLGRIRSLENKSKREAKFRWAVLTACIAVFARGLWTWLSKE